MSINQQIVKDACCGPSCCTPEAAADPTQATAEELREVVKQKYGQAVTAALKGAKASCCGSSSTQELSFVDPITRNLYGAEQAADLPADALTASFGCGNPTALAELRAGEVVLDLGSGGGIDVLLSARRVGPTGFAYGLDMTDEMLALANKNKATAGATNVVFLKGTIESIPLPDASVDVIISNCVINLAANKDTVLREAFRVLRPGGRFAVSDVVLKKALPAVAQKSFQLWTGCVAGALLDQDYQHKLAGAGFDQIGIEPTRIFGREELQEMARTLPAGSVSESEMEQAITVMDGAVISAFVRATKPGLSAPRA